MQENVDERRKPKFNGLKSLLKRFKERLGIGLISIHFPVAD